LSERERGREREMRWDGMEVETKLRKNNMYNEKVFVMCASIFLTKIFVMCVSIVYEMLCQNNISVL
jgi:hypothetical protein